MRTDRQTDRRSKASVLSTSSCIDTRLQLHARRRCPSAHFQRHKELDSVRSSWQKADTCAWWWWDISKQRRRAQTSDGVMWAVKCKTRRGQMLMRNDSRRLSVPVTCTANWYWPPITHTDHPRRLLQAQRHWEIYFTVLHIIPIMPFSPYLRKFRPNPSRILSSCLAHKTKNERE